MTEPIVFIVRNRVKRGLFEDFRKHYRDSVPPIEASKPSTLIQLAYVNEDATEVVIVRLFPDAEAMDLHLQGADERSKAAYEFIDPTSIEIYGTPNEYTMEMIHQIAGPGIDVTVKSQSIGGFIRAKSG